MTGTPPNEHGHHGQNQGPQWHQPGGPYDQHSGPDPRFGQPYQQPPQPLSPEDQRLWATLIHVGGILLNFIAPLVGYLVLRDRGPFVREHARVALNFHITMAIGYAAGVILSPIGIGFLLVLAVSVLSIVFGVIAAVRASAGEFYRYPLSIEFVKE